MLSPQLARHPLSGPPADESERGDETEPVVALAPARPAPRTRPVEAAPLITGATRVAKRSLDLIAALLILVVGAPISLVVAVLIKLEDGGPVFFRQRRIGLNGVPFTVCKFRSMRDDAEVETGPVWAQPSDPRITRVGGWLRPLGIDEIPQAWNVLRGEMSLVGPRPERPEFVDVLNRSIPGFERRHAVRPGITGWAQVHLPHVASVEDARRRAEYDLYYLANFSLGLDLEIMARTLKVLALGGRERAC